MKTDKDKIFDITIKQKRSQGEPIKSNIRAANEFGKLDVRFLGKEIKLIQAVCKKTTLNNWHQVPDAAIYFGDENLNKIHSVAKGVKKQRGVALFVKLQPTINIDIPIFVLSMEEFKHFEAKGSSVTIQSVAENSTKLTKTHEANLVKSKFEPKVSKKIEAKVSKAMIVKSVPENSTKLTKTHKADFDESEGIGDHPRLDSNKKNQNRDPSLIERAFSYFVPQVRKPLKSILHEDCNWMKDDLKSYLEAVRLLKISSKYGHEMKEIETQLNAFMEGRGHKIDIVLLAFAMSVLQNLSYSNELLLNIKYCIKNIPCNQFDSKLHESFETKTKNNMPHQVLKKCISLWCYNRESSYDKDTVSGIAFVLTYHCGMTEPKVFLLLQKIVDPKWFHSSEQIFLRDIFCDRSLLYSLGLVVQDSLEYLCTAAHIFWRQQMGLDCEQNTCELKLHTSVSFKIVQIIQRSDSLTYPLIEDIVSLLEHIHFNDLYYTRRVVEALVESCIFDQLEFLWKVFDVMHKYYDLFQNSLRDVLIQNLKSSTRNRIKNFPNLDKMTSILSSPLGEFFQMEELVGAIKEYFHSVVKYRSCEHKRLLQFSDFLFKKFEEYLSDEDLIEMVKHSICSSSQICCIDMKTMRAIFDLANENPHIFYHESRLQLNKLIADNIINQETMNFVKKNLTLFQIDLTVESNTLLGRLTTNIIEVLKEGCNNIQSALELYENNIPIVREETSTFMTFVLKEVIINALDNWKPTTIFDILEQEVNMLITLKRACIDFFPEFSSCVQNICFEWNSCFEKGNVVFIEIEKMRKLYSMKKWETMTIFDVMLPSDIVLDKRIHDVYVMCKNILEKMTINNDEENSTIQKQLITDVLKGYGNMMDLTSDTVCLLKKCEELSTLTRFSSDGKKLKQKYAFSEVEQIQNALIHFCEEKKRQLTIASYFLQKDSVLFKDSIEFGHSTVSDIDTFLDNISTAAENLTKLLKLESECIFSTLTDSIHLLSERNKNLEEEIEILFSCASLDTNNSDKDNFFVCTFLIKIAKLLGNFIQSCKQLKFGFLEDDAFVDLQVTSANLTENKVCEWSKMEILQCALRLHDHFFTAIDESQKKIENFNVILPWMNFFSCLSNCSEVWTLVVDMGWSKDDGLKLFQDSYENITNVLLFAPSESFEMDILDGLDPTVKLISRLIKCSTSTSVSEFSIALQKMDLLPCNKVDSMIENILMIQQNVTSVREWFTDGLDEVSSVFSKFDIIWRKGLYKIKDNALCLYYCKMSSEDSMQQNEISEMKGNTLSDFVEQLGFDQHENSEISRNTSSFIDQYQILHKLTENYIYCASFGFKTHLADEFEYKVNQTLSEVKLLLTESCKLKEECDQWLHILRKKNPISLLFWIEELQKINSLLYEYFSSKDEEVMTVVTTMILSRIIPFRLDEETRLNALLELKKEITSFSGVVENSCDGWLETISYFLESWHKNIGSPCYLKANPTKGDIGRGTFLHYFNCQMSHVDATLLVLQHIFKTHLPEHFELLDLSYSISTKKLALFFERVLAFSKNTFVLINIQELLVEQQEMLLNFLSESDRINLHCIQLADSMVHSSPFIQHINWSDVKLREIRILKEHIEEVTIVSALKSGTGKSKFIKELMDKVRHNDTDINTASLCLHEGTTIGGMIKTLNDKFKGSVSRCVIHFNFMVSVSSKYCALMKRLNYFFQSLLLTRVVIDPVSHETFLLASRKYSFFVELEGNENELRNFIPILAYFSIQKSPTIQYSIDDKARRVCTYLRAYKDGTINRKFQPANRKRLMFVIDRSGSMGNMLSNGETALNVAIDNALEIFDSHIQNEDYFGAILFDHEVHLSIPLQQVNGFNDMARLKAKLNTCRQIGGGTSMYKALCSALKVLESHAKNTSWIVCLTDGCSDSHDFEKCRNAILQSSPNLNIIIIGVNLYNEYQKQLQGLCQKYQHAETKGFFVPSAAKANDLNMAFKEVAGRIPVSQTFELDGELTSIDCNMLMKEYLPEFVAEDEMLRKKFWIEFLYRRVKVLDANESFNYNENYDDLGSSLMQIMLIEAEKLLSTKQNLSWDACNHEQLIYDFTDPKAPEFRLICTAPEKMGDKIRETYENFDLPGFYIPQQNELSRRDILDRYLSQALSIPLTERNDGTKHLSCVDENEFVLTLDFTMKLLNLHERVACHIPCIIEGETGVSKTALTRMYSILRNSALSTKAKLSTQNDLQTIASELIESGFDLAEGPSAYDRIRNALVKNDCSTISSTTDLGRSLYQLIQNKCDQRLGLFQDFPMHLKIAEEGNTTTMLELLTWFSNSILEQTFFSIDVDASLDEENLVSTFNRIRETARKLMESNAIVMVFFDEVNTSSMMGLFKEIIVDHSICGDTIEKNIVVVAACNPSGRKSIIQGNMSRENDLGKEWASGHYQVNTLPKSLELLKWEYGVLSPVQEKEFILRRFENLPYKFPCHLISEFTDLVAESQNAIRTFAFENIMNGLRRNSHYIVCTEEIQARAKSSVSLRDIQRTFSLFDFFVREFPLTIGNHRESIHLSIAVVYYFKLDRNSRESFVKRLKEIADKTQTSFDFLDLLDRSLLKIIKETKLPYDIALTKGLQENIFMTVVCALSSTPLMIVGPPGTSKTLSINSVSDNANGEESPNEFYRNLPRLSTFHYQCSKTSTSKEVSSVFEKAIQRQENVDRSNHKCLVFMDEAGLPEEDKESLKVLHYYLEGHMSSKAKVSFVAITNHVLDAAKSNRCVSLLRQEPDSKEMLRIAAGVLFDSSTRLVKYNGSKIPPDKFACNLCRAYMAVLAHSEKDKSEQEHSSDNAEHEVKVLGTFFGLRDFIYFLKYLRKKVSSSNTVIMEVSSKEIVYGLERNFNGIAKSKLRSLVKCFFSALSIDIEKNKSVASLLRSPVAVLKDALTCDTSNTRYILIIDESEDDSIMRLLHVEALLNISSRNLFKLSGLPENADMEKLTLVSAIKFAACQGKTAILSQTDSINESFYDLFNRHFREVKNSNGEGCLYANIAVGGVSRRSRIHRNFRCIVHVRASELNSLPAPFLNRFEKYRLSTRDILESKLSCKYTIKEAFLRSKEQVLRLCDIIGTSNLCGFTNHTIDSFYLNLMSHLNDRREFHSEENYRTSSTFNEYVITFIESLLPLKISTEEYTYIFENASKYFTSNLAEVLHRLIMYKTKIDQESMIQIFRKIVHGEPDTIVATMILNLVEMAMTHQAIRSLIGLATPEALLTSRNQIPQKVLKDYFAQEHFSFEHFLDDIGTKRKNNCSKYVVHTRSNSSLLCLTATKQNIQNDTTLDHPKQSKVVIENLAIFRNEITLRSEIEAWLNHSSLQIFVLVVDMSHQDSTDRVNFVRCCIDHSRISTIEDKVFIIALHYSPTAFSTNSYYPALFLGGWEHTFLDSLSGSISSSEMKDIVKHICFPKEKSSLYLSKLGKSFIQDVIISLTRLNVLYPDQLERMKWKKCTSLYQQSYDLLEEWFLITLNDISVVDIFCDKFASLWTDKSLSPILVRASKSIIDGTSQMSLTMCLRTMLSDTMKAFVTLVMREANGWKNLDLLTNNWRSKETDSLFLTILQDLPMLPIEELMLQRIDIVQNLRDIPPSSYPLEVKFPFFYFVSTFLDQLIENTFQIEADHACNDNHTILKPESSELILKRAMQILSGTEKSKDDSKRALVLKVVEHVQSIGQKSPVSLFKRYLDQFMTWKLSLKLESIASVWFLERLMKLSNNQYQLNIILMHVASRIYEIELIQLKAITDDSRCALILCGIVEDDTISFNGALHQSFINWFEMKLMHNISDIQGRLKWLEGFELFLHRISDVVIDEKMKQNKFLGHQLRILSFFYIVFKNAPTKKLSSECLKRWYDRKRKRLRIKAKTDTKLSTFFEILECNLITSEMFCFVEMTLKHFFSLKWLSNIEFGWEEDLHFLAKYVDICNEGIKHLNFGILLKNTCIFGVHLEKGAETSENITDPLLGFSISRLQVINSNLQCKGISNFDEDEERIELPHYVPAWGARDPSMNMIDHDQRNSNGFIHKFFSNYENSFSSDLSDEIFDIILATMIEKMDADISSEQILLRLWSRIEKECTLTRKDQNLHHSKGSFIGSPLGVLILEAYIVCFVLKVSYEIGHVNSVSSLTGVHSEKGMVLLSLIMSSGGVRWQEIFFLNIIRVGGKARLISSLSDRGILSQFSWTKDWRDGLPIDRKGIEQKLRHAETDLQETIQEEERKAIEYRICPHCGQHFMIAQMNCGSFICGRHNKHTTPLVGGNGCGQEFNVNNASFYIKDEEKIKMMRSAVKDERKILEHHLNKSSLWDDLDQAHLPFLTSTFYPKKCFAPTSIAINTINCDLFRDMVDRKLVVTQFCLLPDLIEFYIWIHSTFRFLITMDDARTLELCSLMKAEVLQKRFNSVIADHILSLWNRLNTNLRDYLTQNSNQVYWNCDLVKIPFNNLSNVSLIMLLSVYDHPTEGYDYLFIIINHIASLYNNFTTKVIEHLKQAGHAVPEKNLHPKSLINGSSWSAAIKSLEWMSSEGFSLLTESYRKSQADEYDKEGIYKALIVKLSIYNFRIDSPIKFLRSKHRFRLEFERDENDLPQTNVHRGSHELYFAHLHDCTIYEDCLQNGPTVSSSLDRWDDNKNHFMLNFHGLDYIQLRGLLEGVRSICHKISVSRFDSLGDALKQSEIIPHYESPVESLHELGILQLSQPQARLLMSLDSDQMCRLIKFVGYQLASEAYLYSALPISMNTPIDDVSAEMLASNIMRIVTNHGIKLAMNSIDDFQKDILNFYQNQIRNICSSSNDSMRDFLERNNFCDDETDAIFEALPIGITVRNYIPLQQMLHQMKLQISMQTEAECVFDKEEVIEEKLKPIRGRFWLWMAGQKYGENDREELDEASDGTDSISSWLEQSEVSNELWFEGYINKKKEIFLRSKEENSTSDNFEDHVIFLTEYEAAEIVQKWWKKIKSIQTKVGKDNGLMRNRLVQKNE